MKIAFIGGGNMAAALISGLSRRAAASRDRVVAGLDAPSGAGAPPAVTDITVVEPDAARRETLARAHGLDTGRILAAPGPALAGADILVLAVKPQQMRLACAQLLPYVGRAAVLSIAAGIRARDLARWLASASIVRAMPNTPALVGAGITAMAALPGVDSAQRDTAQQVMEAAGAVLWFDDEAALDAVTAVSGSGPAYVFYFLEALAAAGEALGLAPEAALQLALATFAGSTLLAQRSDLPLRTLREQVTSKGGTTAAALSRLDAAAVAAGIRSAVAAAASRAHELGDEFGRVD